MDLNAMLLHQNMSLKALADPAVKPISFESMKEITREASQVRGFGCHCNTNWMKQVCLPVRRKKKDRIVEGNEGEEDMHEVSGRCVPVADTV